MSKAKDIHKKPRLEEVKSPPPPEPGVKQEIEYCDGCGAPVRRAVLQGDKLNVAEIYVNHMPIESILPSGEVLLQFRPHNKSCKAPARSLILPGGQIKVL
jgi:hypothetical protein